MDKFHVVLILLAVVLVAFFARLAYIDFFNPLDVLRGFVSKIRNLPAHMNMRRTSFWVGDVFIAIFPQENFLEEDTQVCARQIKKHFFSTDGDASMLKIHCPQGRLLTRILREGESLCALKKREFVPEHVATRATLLLIYKGDVVKSWKILFNPKKPTITKNRAVVFVEGSAASMPGTLYVRTGPGVVLRCEPDTLIDYSEFV